MKPANHLVSTAFREDFAQAKLEELEFPTSLDASRRVLKAVEDPDIGLASLAKIVIAEPLLSAKVVRLANSAAMNPAGLAVRDVRQAVTRIGLDPVKAVAMILILNQLRQFSSHAGTRQLADRLWERSVSVSALAYVIAKKMTLLNPDEAMFAGIVHDLGRFFLLARAGDYPDLLENPAALAETVNDLNEQATRRLLEALELPSAAVDAVTSSSDDGTSRSLAMRTLGDVLFAAKALSPRPDPFATLDARESATGDAAEALAFDQDTIAEVIAASGDEIYSIIIALES